MDRVSGALFSRYEVLVFLLIALVHLGASLVTVVPAVYPDEIGYLMNAAALTGFQSDFPSSYFPGYSLLISPAFLIGGSPEAVYLAVKLINTALFTGTAIIVFRLILALQPMRERSDVLLAVAVGSAYPAYLILNGLAMSEMAFIFFFALSGWLSLRLTERALSSWVWFSLSLGFLFIVHPKSAPVIFAGLLVLGYLANVQRRYVGLMVSLAIIGVSAAVASLLKGFIAETLTLSTLDINIRYPSVAALIVEMLSWRRIGEAFLALGGQLFYLVTATLGAVVFGVFLVAKELRSSPLETRPSWAFLLLSFLGTIAVSAVFFTPSEDAARFDHLVYGRYNEAILFPFLVLGLLAIPRSVKPWLYVVGLVALLSALVYFAVRGYEMHSFAFFNILSLFYLQYIWPSNLVMHPALVLGVFSVFVGLWLLLARLSSSARVLPIVFAVFAFTAASYAFDQSYIVSHARQMSAKAIPQFASNNIEPGSCINYDLYSSDWRKANLYPFLLYRYPLKRVMHDQPETFCSRWLVSDRPEISGRFPGAKAMAAEELGNRETLWLLPQDQGDAPADPM